MTMTSEQIARIREVLTEIRVDAKNDSRNFDGQPFNGRTVAEYFGNQGAQIDALAHVCLTLLDELEAR